MKIILIVGCRFMEFSYQWGGLDRAECHDYVTY